MNTASTIADMQAFNGSDVTTDVRDPLRGGIFNFTTEALTPDYGTIFPATAKEPPGGFWVRQFDNVRVMPEWYGAQGDGVADDWEAIQAAMDSAYGVIVLDETYMVSKPVDWVANKQIELNGTITPQNSVKTFLTADVSIGATTIQALNAEDNYFVGQQVVISDDNMTVQGGSTGQTRRTAKATRVVAVSGNTITIESGLNVGFTVAANVYVQHLQNAILAEDIYNPIIYGRGLVEANKANQANVDPVILNATSEDTRYGNGVTFKGCMFPKIDGITVQNAAVQNAVFYQCQWASVLNFTSLTPHDKCLLLWESNDGVITNYRGIGADYEDGVYFYDNSKRWTVNNAYIENCSRTGVRTSNTGVKDIFLNNVFIKDSGTGLYGDTVDNMNGAGITIVGGGLERYLAPTTKRFGFRLRASTNCKLEVKVRDFLLGDYATQIEGNTRDCELNISVFDGNLSSNLGYAVRVTSGSGFSPSRVIFMGGAFLNNKRAFDVISTATAIRAQGNIFNANTADVVNNAGTQFVAVNNIGLADINSPYATSYSDGNISKTANYTILAADYGRNGILNVYVNATAGAVQIELEAAASMGTATTTKIVNVIKTDASANAVTIKGNGATLINAANTYLITAQYDNASVKSNGTQYYIFT